MRAELAPECPQRQGLPVAASEPSPSNAGEAGRSGMQGWGAPPVAGPAEELLVFLGESAPGTARPTQCVRAGPSSAYLPFSPRTAELSRSSRALAHHSQCADGETELGWGGAFSVRGRVPEKTGGPAPRRARQGWMAQSRCTADADAGTGRFVRKEPQSCSTREAT